MAEDTAQIYQNEEVLADGHVHYDDGIPAFPKVKLWEMGWEGTKFIVTRDNLHLRRGEELATIPLSGVQSITSASGSWGPRLALRYSDQGVERVLRVSWTTMWGPRAYERLVAALVSGGVGKVYAWENGQEREISDHIAVDTVSGRLATRPSRPDASEATNLSQATPSQYHCKSCNSQAQWLPNGQLWCPRCESAIAVKSRGKEGEDIAKGIVAIIFVIGIILAGIAWYSGQFDDALAPYGLNSKPCGQNFFGTYMCGDTLKSFCQQNYDKQLNGEACDEVLGR